MRAESERIGSSNVVGGVASFWQQHYPIHFELYPIVVERSSLFQHPIAISVKRERE